MRILELQLDAFGPFTQVALDFSRGRAGVHVVYGPNEAGKTSALRAIRDLFFGIPLRSPDDFIHPSKNLRLGGVLEHSSGDRLAFVRLKRNKNPLLQADGTTPLDPAVLGRFLGGVDQALFQAVFGINHDALVAGGQAIIEGGGNLGNALFAASSGIANFKSLQQALQEKADELFKAGGRNQKIPKAIAELREADRLLKTVQLPSDRWARHEEALRLARCRQGELEERRRRVECDANRFRRIQAALPLFSERLQHLADLERLRDAPSLPADFGERRRRAQLEQATAATEIRRARQSLAELTTRLEAIAVPTRLLDAEAEIEALRNRRAEQRKAQEDRIKRERDLQEKEHAARDVLQSLGKPRSLDQADSLRLRVDEPPRIAQLGHQFTELSTRRDGARAQARKHGDLLKKLRRDLESLGTVPDRSALRAALLEARNEGDLEGRLAKLSEELAPRERELAVALRRLPGWKGTPEALELLAVPLTETIARHEAALQAAEASVRDLSRTVTGLEESLRALDAKLREQSLQLEVPCEQDLEATRKCRDAGWSLVRAAWLDERPDEASRDIFGSAVEPPATLAEGYETAVALADELADRLRREAHAVASRAEYLAQSEQHQVSLVQAREQLGQATQQRDREARDWQALLEAAGVPAMSPAELRAWLVLRDKVLAKEHDVRELREQASRLKLHAETHRNRLAALVADAAATAGTLGSVLEAAATLLKRDEDTARKRDRLEAQVAAEQGSLDAADALLEETEAELTAWRVPWGEMMGRIGLGPDATPEQANVVVGEVSKLFQLLEDAAGFRSRIKGIDRDAERFLEEARALANRLAPGHAEQPPEEIADALWASLRAARDDAQKHKALQERIEVEQHSLEAAEKQQAAAGLELAALCRDAGCTGEDDLPAAEQRSGERARVENDLKRCEQLIRQQSAGASVEAFALEVDGANPDSLQYTLEGLEAELKSIEDDLREANQTIGSEKTVLDQMDGSSKAAEANEAIGFALAQLSEDVPRFAVLRLASRILQRGMERYRERNQGPMLARASELFAALTQGSFERLKVDTNDRDEAVLVGVRPGGQSEIGVRAMSAGSCDQLYLALRIAYLEHWLSEREPIPFIVDDILHAFDDDRAMAALRVLGELSRKTQVIFFTHHAHLLELARECLLADVLFPHSLPTGAAL